MKERVVAQQMHDWLVLNGPYRGLVSELIWEVNQANGTNWTTWDGNNALYWLRHPDNQRMNGWTIPYQTRGQGPKAWRVLDNIDAFDPSEQRAEDGARDLKTDELVNQVDRLDATINLRMQHLHRGSREYRALSAASLQLRAGAASLASAKP